MALTRARNHLTLCYPMLSQEGGQGRLLLRPSRFLAELTDPTLYERWQVEEAYQSPPG